MKNEKQILNISDFDADVGNVLFGQNIEYDVSKKGTNRSILSYQLGQEQEATGMGSAFVALADDPSALYWNPAGIY